MFTRKFSYNEPGWGFAFYLREMYNANFRQCYFHQRVFGILPILVSRSHRGRQNFHDIRRHVGGNHRNSDGLYKDRFNCPRMRVLVMRDGETISALVNMNPLRESQLTFSDGESD